MVPAWNPSHPSVVAPWSLPRGEKVHAYWSRPTTTGRRKSYHDGTTGPPRGGSGATAKVSRAQLTGEPSPTRLSRDPSSRHDGSTQQRPGVRADHIRRRKATELVATQRELVVVKGATESATVSALESYLVAKYGL